MRRIVLVVCLAVAGCGDSSHDTSPEEHCPTLSPDTACAADPDCQPAILSPWNASDHCWGKRVPAACVPMTQGITGTSGCARDLQNNLWKGTLFPVTWSGKDLPDSCGTEPACDDAALGN
jgi:hypothetical protein